MVCFLTKKHFQFQLKHNIVFNSSILVLKKYFGSVFVLFIFIFFSFFYNFPAVCVCALFSASSSTYHLLTLSTLGHASIKMKLRILCIHNKIRWNAKKNPVSRKYSNFECECESRWTGGAYKSHSSDIRHAIGVLMGNFTNLTD